jgi:AcrR family transcriptional regulator
MAPRKFLLADPAKREGSDNAHTREKIVDALTELMAEGEKLTHDAVAARAGISRRTVYRYFPDQESLRAAVWARFGPSGGIPQTLDALLGGMPERFGNFDRNAAKMTVAMASAEGRAIRNVVKDERIAAYRGMFENQVSALSEPDRIRAIAAIQLITSGFAWREMRDQWGFDAAEMSIACRWAVETLLADLARRGGKPLSEGPADAG